MSQLNLSSNLIQSNVITNSETSSHDTIISESVISSTSQKLPRPLILSKAFQKQFIKAYGSDSQWKQLIAQYDASYIPVQRQIRAHCPSSTTIRVYQAYNDIIADSAIEHQTFVPPAFSMNRMTWIKPSFLWMMYRAGWGFKDTNQVRILAIDLHIDAFQDILRQGVLSNTHSTTISKQSDAKQPNSVKTATAAAAAIVTASETAIPVVNSTAVVVDNVIEVTSIINADMATNHDINTDQQQQSGDGGQMNKKSSKQQKSHQSTNQRQQHQHDNDNDDDPHWREKSIQSDVVIQWDPERDIFSNPLAFRSLQVGIRGRVLKQYCHHAIANITDVTELAHSIYDKIKNGNLIEALELLPEEIVVDLNIDHLL